MENKIFDKELNEYRFMTLEEMVEQLPQNETIVTNFVRAYSVVNKPIYDTIVCSISGGSDSDVMLDILTTVDINKKIIYVWFDTGLEYQATKDHLIELENKYGIEFKKLRPQKPIPLSCKSNGEPFCNKRVSDMIERLQKNNFAWEDKPFDELIKKYPNCRSSLHWWCNDWGENSSFNINRNTWLKEFLISNPPTFNISGKCCKYAKKDLIHKAIKIYNADLNCYGVRKSEGGARATAYKNCFTDNYGECDEYRPLFFYKDSDKADYENFCGINHSKCYSEYGLKRTGCAGCPFGNDYEFELEVIKKYEPKLYNACINIFKNSYEYTKKYRQFQKEMKEKNKKTKKEEFEQIEFEF